MVSAVSEVFPNTALFGLAGGRLLEIAEASGLSAVHEFFADRNYLVDGSLVPRTSSIALIHDPEAVAQRTLNAVRLGEVTAAGGDIIQMSFQTVCVHGDSVDSVAMIEKIRNALLKSNIQLKAVR